MKWKGKEQFYKTGIKTAILGFFLLLVTYLLLRTSFDGLYASDLLIVIATATIGSLIFVTGLVLMIISLLILEN